MNKPTEQGYEQTGGGDVVKYQRLEIEKIEFGDSDFMVFSGNINDYTGSGLITYNGVTFSTTRATCVNVYGTGGGNYFCGSFWCDYPDDPELFKFHGVTGDFHCQGF